MRPIKSSFLQNLLLLAITAFAGLLCLTGCGGEKQSQPSTPSISPESSVAVSQKQLPEDTASYLTRFKFKTADGAEALNIKRYADHDKIEISFEGIQETFKGRTDRADRVKYKAVQGEAAIEKTIAEVKLKDDSFKLVDENEALLWKVKYNDDKIKISNNEDGNNSCEIKIKSADKGEIRDSSGNEIGNVRFYSDNGKLKVKDAAGTEILVTKDSKFSLAPGVIMFKHIPLQHRAIIISEVLRKGK